MTHLGDVVYGDAGTTIVLTVKDKATGTVRNMTGATSIALKGVRSGERTVTLNLTGALSGTPTDGTVTFSDVTATLDPGTRRRDAYMPCRLFWTQSTKPFVGLTEYSLGIVTFP